MRVVPKVEREEFFNVGVILYCGPKKFLQTRYEIKEDKLRAFCEELEMASLRDNLAALDRIAAGADGSGPIGKLSLPERFRWLTATRSTVLQTSKVHPGLTTDPGKTLEKLFAELVG
ncbi:MAG: DUF3037 domain-containing protein [Lysobacteraceae bacterium]|nr:MAG: DUF3037 domain-containing protein [Xanthomonadaceae bacterium]